MRIEARPLRAEACRSPLRGNRPRSRWDRAGRGRFALTSWSSRYWIGSVCRVISPEATTDLALQRERVRRALADLPENQARVIFLAYFRGYTHREIAAALEQPLGTVKKRIQLGMQKLRALLEDEQT